MSALASAGQGFIDLFSLSSLLHIIALGFWCRFLYCLYDPVKFQELTDFCQGCASVDQEGTVGYAAARLEMFHFLCQAALVSAGARLGLEKSKRAALLTAGGHATLKFLAVALQEKPITSDHAFYATLGLEGIVILASVVWSNEKHPTVLMKMPKWNSTKTTMWIAALESLWGGSQLAWQWQAENLDKNVPGENNPYVATVGSAHHIAFGCSLLLLGEALMDDERKKVCETLHWLQLIFVVCVLPVQLPFILPNDGIWWTYAHVLLSVAILVQSYFCLARVQSHYMYMFLAGVLMAGGALGLFSMPDTATTMYGLPDNVTGWDRMVVQYIGTLLWLLAGVMYCLHGQKGAIVKFEKLYVNGYLLLILFELCLGTRPFPTSFNQLAPPMQDLGAFSWLMLTVWLSLLVHLGLRKDQRLETFEWVVDGAKLFAEPLIPDMSKSNKSMKKRK